MVGSYTTSVVGVPVYLHYCGGELEKVNFMVKTKSCCDGLEEETEENGCCKDEGSYVQNHTSFTFKQASYHLTCNFIQLAYLNPGFLSLDESGGKLLLSATMFHPPHSHYKSTVITTSVLRI